MATRTWARTVGGQPLVTAYGYNGAGEVASVDYSDSTPDVMFGYNRRGQQTTVTANGVTTAMAYNIPGQLLAESYTGGPLDGLSVTNGYDDLLRRTNVSVQNSSTPILQTAYAYDAASRLSTVSEGTNAATYSYLANSPLVESITFKQGAATRMTTTKSYDLLNRLTSIQSINSQPSTINSFAYAYNDANQRTAVTNADASRWNFGYDTLGQVTSGKKSWSDGSKVAGEQFEYTFDDIGNRKQSRYGGDANGAGLRRFNYSVNALNQYTTRSAALGTTRFANVLGEATNAATVTVNNQAPYRKGDFFRLELAVTNTSPVWLGVTNIAVLNQGTNVDLIATNAGNVFLPATPETFTNDLDGNLISDGRFALTWDAENRLVKVESFANAPAGSKRKVEWTFDGLGRRVRQTEFVWNASTNDYQLSTDTKLVSDGWRNIAELNATNNALLRSFAWGLDLSGSLGGAGGVGGLLMINDSSTINSQPSTHFYSYDGNGNVAALVSAATGTASANYEYEPFGVTLRATGPMALENPFRFSTKRTSDVTDWVLYEYRIYTPETGRWPNRDPLGEPGFEVLRRRKSDVFGDGPNLYLFVGNAPVSFIDPFGLTRVESGTWFPGSISDGVSYWADVNDGQSETVTLRRITMAEVEAEMKRLVGQLQGYEKVDGGKSRKYEGGFDSNYFEGENKQHQYYLVDGKGPLYADNEINYIGIGLYEAWLCNSLTKAKAIVWVWKLGKWHDVPSAGTMHWLEVGHNNYGTIEGNSNTSEQHGRSCRCNTPSDRRDDPREPLR